ncbi:MAG: hypothetical protein R3F59_08175 [Myxococcota bacterium]
MVSVALAVGWLRSPDFQARSIRVAAAVLEAELGEPVAIDRIGVRLWPPGIDVDGLVIASGETGEAIASADRIRIPFKLTARGPRIGRLELTRPTVDLHLDERGQLVEFRDRHRGGRPLREIPFRSLRITDGTVRVTHPEGAVTVEHLEAEPAADGRTSLSGDLALRVRDLTDGTSFRWDDLRITPDAVDVGDLVLDLAVADLSARGHFPLLGPLDADVTTSVDLDALKPLLVPPRAAHGRVDVTLHAEGSPQDPTLTIDAAGWGLGADMPGVFTPLLTYDLHEMTLSAVARKDGVHVTELVLPWAGGRFVATGDITPDKRLENGHVTMEEVTLAPLLQAFDAAPTPWVDFVGNADVAVTGSLVPLVLEGDFDLSVDDLHVGDGPIANLGRGTGLMLDLPSSFAQGSLVLTKEHVVLTAPTVRGPKSTGSTIVDIGFGPRGPLDLQFDLSGADVSDFQPLGDVGLQGTGRVSGRIAGPFNRLAFEGEGEVDGFEVLGIHYADHLRATLRSPDMKSIYLTDADATLGDSHYTGRYGIDFKPPMSMTPAIEVDRGRVEDMVHMFVDLDGLKGDLTGTLTLDGPLYDLTGEQHLKLANVELYGEKFPSGEAHGFMDQGVFTLDDLRVRRNGGRAGLTLRGASTGPGRSTWSSSPTGSTCRASTASSPTGCRCRASCRPWRTSRTRSSTRAPTAGSGSPTCATPGSTPRTRCWSSTATAASPTTTAICSAAAPTSRAPSGCGASSPTRSRPSSTTCRPTCSTPSRPTASPSAPSSPVQPTSPATSATSGAR